MAKPHLPSAHRRSGGFPGVTYANQNPQPARFGTSRTDGYGNRIPGEVNGFGLPLQKGAPGLTPEKDWQAQFKQPTADSGAATAGKAAAGAQAGAAVAAGLAGNPVAAGAMLANAKNAGTAAQKAVADSAPKQGDTRKNSFGGTESFQPSASGGRWVQTTGTTPANGAGPAMTNRLPGDAMKNSMPDRRVVEMKPEPHAPALTGNKATDDANQRQFIADHVDWSRNMTRPVTTAPDRNLPPDDPLRNAVNKGPQNVPGGTVSATRSTPPAVATSTAPPAPRLTLGDVGAVAGGATPTATTTPTPATDTSTTAKPTTSVGDALSGGASMKQIVQAVGQFGVDNMSTSAAGKKTPPERPTMEGLPPWSKDPSAPIVAKPGQPTIGDFQPQPGAERPTMDAKSLFSPRPDLFGTKPFAPTVRDANGNMSPAPQKPISDTPAPASPMNGTSATSASVGTANPFTFASTNPRTGNDDQDPLKKARTAFGDPMQALKNATDARPDRPDLVQTDAWA